MIINRESLKAFRLSFADAVKELESKYNLKVEMGGITYDNCHFSSKITFTSLETPAVEENINNVNQYLKLLGANFMVGHQCVFHGMSLKVTGCNPKKRKKPIELVDINTNKKYSATVEWVNTTVKAGV